MSLTRTTAALCAAAVVVLGLPGGAQAAKHSKSDQTVKGAGGVEIAITVFKPAAASSQKVPVILHSHGWGGSRETEIGGDVKALLDAGFGVVSVDQRGHGESGGQANVQDPKLETEDMKNVIDRIASLDWVKLDRPNDPVLGAIGASYGGGYQTMTALDEIADQGRTRFNALAPQITWYDLPQSLAPQDVVRTTWNVLLYAAGSSMVPNYIHEAFVWGTATNHWPDGTLYGQPVPYAPNLDKVFHEHSPIGFVEKGIRINVPMLLRQGNTDNLFPLNEGLDLFEKALTPAARSHSYFVTYNGGHALPNAVPPGSSTATELGGGVDACSPKGNFTKVTIDFFKRVFAGRSTNGLLPQPYNFTMLDGETCRSVASVNDETMKVDPLGTGSVVTTAGGGAPLHLTVAEGPVTVTGVPVLKGTVASTGLDGRAFFGLAIGSTPADARVIQNNLMPLRQVLPTTGDKFAIELAGVSVQVPKGQSLFLTITPESDMYFGHASRTPAALVLSNLKLTLPLSSQ
ncbi:MAG: alpha/beta hydrolase family protein [Actinomycetota bacterium]